MAISELYFDSGAAGGGDGSIGTPYNDLNAGIKAATFDTTNGTRCNTKGSFTLTEDIATSLADTGTTAAWVPSRTAPLRFQGYGTTAGDGVVGEIDANASFSVLSNTALDWVGFKDLKFGNVGNRQILSLGDDIAVLNCEVYGATGVSADGLDFDADCLVVGSYFHTIDGFGVLCSGNQLIKLNTFDDCGEVAIENTGNDGWNIFNNIKCSGTADGIRCASEGYYAHNSIWSDGGTGKGLSGSTAKTGVTLLNNCVEGFSGTGGVGIDGTNLTNVRLRAGNKLYNSATNLIVGSTEWREFENEILTGSLFNDPTNLDFSPAAALQAATKAYPRNFKV